MADPDHPGKILARAAGYPYEAPLHSFVQTGAHTAELEGEPDLADRRPLLAYGANASPAVLARKLSALPAEPLPVLRAELADFDVVYSAHISPYGAVPSTLQRSPGTMAPVFVAYPNERQLAALTATEQRNYELRELGELTLRTELPSPTSGALVYLSRHGCLAFHDAELALAAVESRPRRFRALGEVEVLEHVRHLLAPELDLERFVESSLDPGMAAARTTVLRGNALPFRGLLVS